MINLKRNLKNEGSRLMNINSAATRQPEKWRDGRGRVGKWRGGGRLY